MGLVILLLNKATKLARGFQSMEKEYTAVFQLGIVTDTWDAEGNEIIRKEVDGVGTDDIKNLLKSLTGTFEQQPPIFSAKKIAGRPSYYYARSKKYDNRDIILKPVSVKIYAIDLLSFDGLNAEIRVRCSAGTYIRSLVHEIGNRLECGAILTGLVRNKIDGYSLEDAIKIDDILEVSRTTDLDRFKRSIIPCDRIAENDCKEVDWN